MFYIKTSFDGINEYSDINDKFMTNKEQSAIAERLHNVLLTGDQSLKISVQWKAKNIIYIEILKKDLYDEAVLLNRKFKDNNFDLNSLFDYLVAQANALNKKSKSIPDLQKKKTVNSAHSTHQGVLNP